MTFVDTNVVMYAVSRLHPLREPARSFFDDAIQNRIPLCTSAEVLQELVLADMHVQRLSTLDAAISLVLRSQMEVWALEKEDVMLSRQLHAQFPMLGARDLCHLACCQRRRVSTIMTYDLALQAAANGSAH